MAIRMEPMCWLALSNDHRSWRSTSFHHILSNCSKTKSINICSNVVGTRNCINIYLLHVRQTWWWRWSFLERFDDFWWFFTYGTLTDFVVQLFTLHAISASYICIFRKIFELGAEQAKIIKSDQVINLHFLIGIVNELGIAGVLLVMSESFSTVKANMLFNVMVILLQLDSIPYVSFVTEFCRLYERTQIFKNTILLFAKHKNGLARARYFSLWWLKCNWLEWLCDLNDFKYSL